MMMIPAEATEPNYWPSRVAADRAANPCRVEGCTNGKPSAWAYCLAHRG